MRSYPTSDHVLSHLGDKVVSGLASVAPATALDLAEYRRIAPQFVSRHSSRGLANWIHDQAWAHVVEEMEGIDGVVLQDKEPLREVIVGLDYRIRFKRHNSTGRITSYPTQTALQFISQEPDLFSEIFVTWNLCVGYEWDPLLGELVAPVLSLRDGSFNEVIWIVELPLAPPASGGGTATPLVPPLSGPPSPPAIITPASSRDKEEGNTEG